MPRLYVLFEHAAGYSIFKVQEFEEIGMFLPQLEASISDLGRFNSIVSLVGFSPFKTAVVALENMNAISEGLLTDDLKEFIDITVPKGSKRGKVTLGVTDSKLGAAITEALNIQCSHIGAVPEVIRGVRKHFHDLVKGFTEKSSCVAQLGLGHSYSRAKVKFNVHRVDNMIIQSIALLDQLDKDVNTFSMRIKEWYSYHFPELVKIVPDNYVYAKLVKFIKSHKSLSEESLEGLEEITMDSGKAQAILDASRSSMGMDITEIDMINILMFANRVVALADYRAQISEYLGTKMRDVAPNLATLIGDQVGARLISRAGSLTNLAKCPASTVQILGAEKALFRALKTRGNTPKYGLLYNCSFIGRAGPKNKGRISRFLANKCSLASRIDCFAEEQTNIFGEKLKQQVEDRIKFYETGDIPKKNIEVMKEALEEQQQKLAEEAKSKKKNKKRKKSEVQIEEEVITEETPKKKKKRKSKSNGVPAEEEVMHEVVEQIENEAITEETPKKKKKRKSNGIQAEEEVMQEVVEQIEEETPRKKKKKKKNQSMNEEDISQETIEPEMVEETPDRKQKKKKNKNLSMQEELLNQEMTDETPKKKKKKKKETYEEDE